MPVPVRLSSQHTGTGTTHPSPQPGAHYYSLIPLTNDMIPDRLPLRLSYVQPVQAQHAPPLIVRPCNQLNVERR
jgi:hypothetical protein